jgi:hypothetical protein
MSEASLAQSKKSADSSYSIAKQTLDAQIEISQTDLRPFIWYNGQIISDDVKIGGFAPIIRVKNFGKSPAYNAIIYFCIYCLPANIVANFFTQKINRTEGSPLLPPGVEDEIRTDVTATQKIFTIKQITLDSINAGRWLLHMDFQMLYEQYIGGNVIIYTTTFCLYYNILKKEFDYFPSLNSDTWEKKKKEKKKSR